MRIYEWDFKTNRRVRELGSRDFQFTDDLRKWIIEDLGLGMPDMDWGFVKYWMVPDHPDRVIVMDPEYPWEHSSRRFPAWDPAPVVASGE